MEENEVKEVIEEWFNLENTIERLEYEIKTFSKKYYQENSFYSHIVFDSYGVYSDRQRVDEIAINLADASAIKVRRLERFKEQRRLFHRCISRLPPEAIETLRSEEYSQLDRYVYEVIQDIKLITETKNEAVKGKYLKQLKNRMEKIK